MADGIDWKQLIKMAAPVIGGLAAKGAPRQAGFQSGFMQGAEIARAEKERKRLEAQRTEGLGRDYALKGLSHLDGIDDPVQFANVLSVLKEYAPDGGAMFEGMQFPESKANAQRLKELTDQLDALADGGYDLDDLAEGGAALKLGDGSAVSVSDALELTRSRPVDAGGKQIARPKKPAAGGTVDERASRLLTQIRAANKAGDTDTATELEQEYEDLVKAKTDLSGAGRAPVDPEVSGLKKTLLELQAEAARSRLQSGGEATNLSNELKRLQILAQEQKNDAERQKVVDASKADAQKRSNAVRMADDITSVIDTLLDPATGKLTPAAQSIVGMRVPFASSVPGSKAATAKGALDRLTGTLVVDLMREMKEQSRTGATGFGSLTEKELAILQNAASQLSNRNISEASFADELKRIRDKVGLVGGPAATDASDEDGWVDLGGGVRGRKKN